MVTWSRERGSTSSGTLQRGESVYDYCKEERYCAREYPKKMPKDKTMVTEEEED